jgi:glycosyltransferase involved in cell wall biosynthesis
MGARRSGYGMKVVMVGPFAFRPKGTVRARAFFMARALARLGHTVTILMPPYDNLAESGRVGYEDGVLLVNARIRRDDWWARLAVPFRLALRARALGPDVVHVFKPVGYSGLTAGWLRTLTRLPLVVDTDDWEGRGGWADQSGYPRLWRAFFDWQERWVPRHADAITVVSRTLETQVQGFGVDPDRVFYLPNGLDSAWHTPRPLPTEQVQAVRARLGVAQAPLGMYVAHLARGSDLDLALRAWPLVLRSVPEARLVVLGGGEGRPLLEALAAELGLQDRVIFVGPVPQEEVPVWLAAADVTINPYRDSLVNRAKCAGKLIDYMAAAKPVVAAALGQNVEYLEEGVSGVLTEPGDVRDLAQGIVRVLADPAWAAQLGRAARARLWDAFDWNVMVEVLEEVYRVAVGDGARRRSSL